MVCIYNHRNAAKLFLTDLERLPRCYDGNKHSPRFPACFKIIHLYRGHHRLPLGMGPNLCMLIMITEHL